VKEGDACPKCGMYIVTRMPSAWRCAACEFYLADEDGACVSCGAPGEVNCDSCLEVICLECVDTHEPKCEERMAKEARQIPIKRAEQAEQMAAELASKLQDLVVFLVDQGMDKAECPELVKYDRLYDKSGKPRP